MTPETLEYLYECLEHMEINHCWTEYHEALIQKAREELDELTSN